MNDDIKALRMKVRNKSNRGTISDRLRVFWQISSWPPPNKVEDAGGGSAKLTWNDLYADEDYPAEIPEGQYGNPRMSPKGQYEEPPSDPEGFRAMFQHALSQAGFDVQSVKVSSGGTSGTTTLFSVVAVVS